MFVRKSGPTTAKANPIHTSAPKWNDWLVVCGIPTAAIGSQPSASTSAEIRNGEYRRISGVIETEYIAHVSAVDTASPSPTRRARRTRPSRRRRMPRRPSETAVASQNPRPIRSSPITLATTPMKIGVVPEEQRHGRGRGLVDRVHEAQLVREDHRRGDRDVAEVAQERSGTTAPATT